MRQDTLVFLLNDDTQEILLAMKKRGFGAGKLNGLGGKVGKDETIETAAAREAREEAGVLIEEKNLAKVAELTFHFAGKPDSDINCHVFLARAWAGEPTESEEMAPGWFSRGTIPYDKMWVDDKYWIPLVLRGEYVTADFIFNHEGSALLKYKIEGAPL